MAYVMVDNNGNKYYSNKGQGESSDIVRSYTMQFTTAGTYTWKCPNNVTSATVEVAGGGGKTYTWNCSNCDCGCGDDS